MDIKVPTN